MKGRTISAFEAPFPGDASVVRHIIIRCKGKWKNKTIYNCSFLFFRCLLLASET